MVGSFGEDHGSLSVSSSSDKKSKLVTQAVAVREILCFFYHLDHTSEIMHILKRRENNCFFVVFFNLDLSIEVMYMHNLLF